VNCAPIWSANFCGPTDAAAAAGNIDIGGMAPSVDVAFSRNCGQVNSPTLSKFHAVNAAPSWVSTSRIWSSSEALAVGAAADVAAALDVDAAEGALLSPHPATNNAAATVAIPAMRMSMCPPGHFSYLATSQRCAVFLVKANLQIAENCGPGFEVARKFPARRSARLHQYPATSPYRSGCAKQLDITITLWLRLRVCQSVPRVDSQPGRKGDRDDPPA
jgi:hypothetical protein